VSCDVLSCQPLHGRISSPATYVRPVDNATVSRVMAARHRHARNPHERRMPQADSST
jgi:hypothetical protein